MIVSHDNDIVIAREIFAFVGKEIVITASRESSPMHVDHNWALVRAVNLRCPDVDAQAVFARHKDGRAAMEQECVLVVARQVMPIGIEVRGELLRADASVCKGVANSGPGFRFSRWHETPGPGGRRAVRHAFVRVYTVPLESADLPC